MATSTLAKVPCRSRCRAGVQSGAWRLLQDLTSRQLWGDVVQRWPPLSAASFPLHSLVPFEVLQRGTVFLGFLAGGQWLLSYVAECHQATYLPPEFSYRLQWWFFLPGRPLRMVRETVLFGGLSLEGQVLISVTQWPCDPDYVLVVGHCRLEDLWHMTLDGVPGCQPKQLLHASYLCPSAGGWPRLLERGKLLLPMGQELLLLDISHNTSQEGADVQCPTDDGWSSVGVQQQVDLGATLVTLDMAPPPRHATVLDIAMLASVLVPRLCTDWGLVYRALVDYDTYVAGGELSGGRHATITLALLLQASRNSAVGGNTCCWSASVLLLWDLATGCHRVASVGSLDKVEAGNDWLRDPVGWLPSWWTRPLDARRWMTNHAALQGKSLSRLRAGPPWSIALS